MAEPFKNNFNVDMLRPLATHLARHVSGFETDAFVADASRDFSDLELKARSNAIRDTLIRYLPDDPIQALDVLCACLHPDSNDALTSGVSDERGVRGWIVMPMSDVVPEIAMEHFDEGMAALRTLTCGFTSWQLTPHEGWNMRRVGHRTRKCMCGGWPVRARGHDCLGGCVWTALWLIRRLYCRF